MSESWAYSFCWYTLSNEWYGQAEANWRSFHTWVVAVVYRLSRHILQQPSQPKQIHSVRNARSFRNSIPSDRIPRLLRVGLICKVGVWEVGTGGRRRCRFRHRCYGGLGQRGWHNKSRNNSKNYFRSSDSWKWKSKSRCRMKLRFYKLWNFK